MSAKELQRLTVLGRVAKGALSLVDASVLMGVSYRQARRLAKKFNENGPAGIAHGSRGRASPKKTPLELAEKVVKLAEEKYLNYNDTHFTEIVREMEGIQLCRESVRRILRAENIGPKKKRRPPKHRSRRPRKPQEGMLVQWDGSPHKWFGDTPCCLMLAVDDATGKAVAGHFRLHECSLGYLLLLKEVIANHGVPCAVYHDRHSCLVRNDDSWSVEEQLAGRRTPTQVGMVLENLGVRSIPAGSPQAKGRVERQFGVLQDRLAAELGTAQIETMDDANLFLQGFFERYNRRFGKSAEEATPAWRKAPRTLDLDATIAFRYTATVANDNTISLGGLVINIPPGPRNRSFAKVGVEARQLVDGSWRVYFQGRIIAKHAPSPLTEPSRTLARRRTAKGAYDSSFVYLASKPGG